MRMPFLDSLPCFSAKGRDDEGRSWHRCSRVIGERRTATALALRQRTRAGSARVRQNGFQWSRALARPCRDKSKAWLVGPSVRHRARAVVFFGWLVGRGSREMPTT
jgi:hypothetical protein